MKIIFFSRLFFPHIGGVEKHVLQVSKKLVEKGHNITVVTELHDSKFKKYEEFEKIKVYRIPIGKKEKDKKYKIWNWLFQHKKLLEEADIIHCHDVFFWYLPFRVLYPFKKVYTTFHGYEGNNIPDWKSKISHKIAEKLSYENMCIGDYLTKWYGTRSKIISYGATEIPQVIPSEKIFSKIIKIVFIGRLEKETGFLSYIKAIKLLKEKKYHVELVVLGSGKLEEEAKDYAKKHKLNVKFKGFVSDVLLEITDCDIVFTSRYLGILEAFAVHKPVIAQYNNVIKKDYLYMSPFCTWIGIASTPSGLAVCTEEVLSKYPKEKINNAYQWVTDHTWETLTDDYLTLWRR